MTSLRIKAFRYIKYRFPQYVNGGELERMALQNGFKASNVSRRLRELYKEGYLDRRLNSRRCVEYAYKIPPVKTEAEKERESEQLLIESLK